MEAARLGLGDYPLSALGRSQVSASTASHQAALAAAGLFGASNQAAMSLMDPWLAASPLLGSTLSHALPGFLAHPQTCYPSYLTPPTSTAASILSAAHHHHQQQQQQHLHHQTTLIDGRHSITLKQGMPPIVSTSQISMSPNSPISSSNGNNGSSANNGRTSSPGMGNNGTGSPNEMMGVGRTSSIANLRLKAKEHLESLTKVI